MNWINGFEQMCYLITALLLVDIFLRKRWTELRLFCSAALAGFALELMAVRVTGIYHYSPQFWISLGTPPYFFYVLPAGLQHARTADAHLYAGTGAYPDRR